MEISESAHLLKIIAKNSETIRLCGGMEFYSHCRQAEIYPVYTFDAVGENIRYRFVGSTLRSFSKCLPSKCYFDYIVSITTFYVGLWHIM